MMRGPKLQSIAVRTKTGIVTTTEPLKLTKDRYKVAGWPFIRGVINFGSSMACGVRALMYSANLQVAEITNTDAETPETPDIPAEPPQPETPETAKKKSASDAFAVTIAVILGIGLSVVLFMLLPTFLAGFVTGFTDSRIVKNLIEGVIRIAIFIGYIGLSSLMSDMKRVWMYHGAEHKTIFCYERELPLTVENARAQPRCHPRCGTSFMFIVMIVSILVFSVMSWRGVFLRIVTRLALLPVVVAVSYEIIKWAGRHDNVATRIISAPGKALQRLTTREPDDEMLEVAIAAITLVLPEEKGADEW
ncbi:MAG: DUF1385 domain-containing protein [Oscillospiraceae bacterium]|jgi:uncharacterized protein YqhQ|nr:DUF1385 domain-containing protein [Oscillospiraceae bacterium]